MLFVGLFCILFIERVFSVNNALYYADTGDIDRPCARIYKVTNFEIGGKVQDPVHVFNTDCKECPGNGGDSLGEFFIYKKKHLIVLCLYTVWLKNGDTGESSIIYNNHRYHNNTQINYIYIFEDELIVNQPSSDFYTQMYYKLNLTKVISGEEPVEKELFFTMQTVGLGDYGFLMFDQKLIIGTNGGSKDILYEYRENSTSWNYYFYEKYKIPGLKMNEMRIDDGYYNGNNGIIYTGSYFDGGVGGVYVSNREDFSNLTQISQVKARLAISDGGLKNGFFYSWPIDDSKSDQDSSCRVKWESRTSSIDADGSYCVADKGGLFFGFKGSAGCLAYVDYDD